MKSRRKKLFLLGTVLLCTFAATATCFKVAEWYFFDKFFYNKDATFGYIKPVYNPLGNSKNPATIEHRIRDLRLVFGGPNAYSKVLGVTDDEDIYKVLLIGDSYVYGNGVRDQDRMSAFLERQLNKVRPTKVYVLAQSGDSIVDNYYKFQHAESVIKPDVAIMGMVINDFILDQTDKYPGEQQFYDTLRQECPQEERKVQWTGPQMTIEEGMDMNLYPSIDPQFANICYYQKILERLEGKPVFFYSFDPLSDELFAEVSDFEKKGWQVMHTYQEMAEQHGFSVASPNNIENFVYTPVATIEGHPSKDTHRLYAESMAKEIMTNPQWKFMP